MNCLCSLISFYNEPRTLRVLLAHNYYLQRGGEDVVFEGERDLLRENGHTTVEFIQHNSVISERNRSVTALSAVWSPRAKRELSRVLRSNACDVAHFHNTFPLFSPSVYSACNDAGVPVVQTLHNYRWLCPAATLYRDGGVCEKCLGTTLTYPSVVYGCYHQSRAQSLVVAGMVSWHRLARTLQHRVTRFIAPTDFLKKKFIENGFPEEKLVVKPHSIRKDPGERTGEGDYVLFLGRLSEEKGIKTLLQCWNSLDGRIPLRIAGDGPLAGEVEAYIGTHPGQPVFHLGFRPPEEAILLLKKARFLIFPSGCYEVFGNVLVEAMACGVPLIVPSHGASKEMVHDGIHGVHFEPGNATDLAEKVRWGYEHQAEMRQMGRNCRKEYERRYTARKNYRSLLEIYREAAQIVRKVSA